jgi:hypothetical protein
MNLRKPRQSLEETPFLARETNFAGGVDNPNKADGYFSRFVLQDTLRHRLV